MTPHKTAKTLWSVREGNGGRPALCIDGELWRKDEAGNLVVTKDGRIVAVYAPNGEVVPSDRP